MAGRDGPVGAEHHVGVEHGEQGVEVAGPRGGEEGRDDLALAARSTSGAGGCPDPAAGAAGELAGGGGRAVEHRGDVVERHREHVVKDEREPLGGGERVEHDEQGQTDRISEQRLLLRSDGVVG